MNLVVGIFVFFVNIYHVENFGKFSRVHDLSIAHEEIVNRYYVQRINWMTSNLGIILFKNVPEKTWEEEKKKFIIHIYKYWREFKSRHLTDLVTNRYNPLKDCPVQNCEFTQNENYFHKADAVIFYLFRGGLPLIRGKNLQQRWVFLSDESPVNTFAGTKFKSSFARLANIFNWSMTYRSDSDVPIPYGRTVALPKPIFPKRMSYEDIALLVPNWKQKRRDVLVTILMSHCRKHRINYVRYLRRFINIDFYGKCSDTFRYRTRCPGHYNADCDVTADYLFYLVLENTSCRQYMTEKLYYNAYLKGAIPIIRNPSLEDCEKLLPPNSFLHADQFNSPVEMVNMIKAIGADDELLLSFHAWRNHFNITNDHGFFHSKSSQMCRLCQALNYNDKSVKWYDEDDIRLYLDPKLLCTTIPVNDFRTRRKKKIYTNNTELEFNNIIYKKYSSFK